MMPTIALAVTSQVSLILIRGLPARLVAAGWDVTIICPDGPGFDEFKDMPGITTVALEMTREPSILADLKSFVAWLKVYRRVQPDLILYGTPKVSLLASVTGMLTKQENRVYLLHGLRSEGASGLSRRLLVLFERLTISCSQYIISVSDSLTCATIRSKAAPEGRIEILGIGSSNGVDTTTFRPLDANNAEVAAFRTEFDLDPTLPTIGYIGRLHTSKGLGDLCQAMLILARSGVKAQLLLIGGADGLDVGADIERLTLAGVKVVATGALPVTALHYAAMDIFCLPTYREGFPNVVLEAAACGRPVVTTDATGAIDSVIDGKTGIIVKQRQPREIAKAIESMLHSPEVVAQYGIAAREFAMQNFERSLVQDRLIARLTEIYND